MTCQNLPEAAIIHELLIQPNRMESGAGGIHSRSGAAFPVSVRACGWKDNLSVIDIIRVRIEDYEDGISLDTWTLKREQEYSDYIAWDYKSERQWWVEDAPEMHKRENLLTAKLDTRRNGNMNVDDIYSASGDWLKASDLTGRSEWHLRIESVSTNAFKQKDGSEKKQAVLKFFGAKKQLGLNVTNKNRMVKMFGKDTDNWISQEVTLYTTETEMDGQTMLGIRIRDKSTTAPIVTSALPSNGNGFVSGLPQQQPPKVKPKMAFDDRNPPPDDMNDEVPF